MPSVKVHCAISKKRTKNNKFESLHKWIDESAKKHGINHRKVKHAYTTMDEKKIINYWDKDGKNLGKKAVVEWLFHIALDNLSTANKRARKTYGKNTYNYFRIGFSNNSNYIHIDMDRKKDNQLKELFSKEELSGEDDKD